MPKNNTKKKKEDKQIVEIHIYIHQNNWAPTYPVNPFPTNPNNPFPTNPNNPLPNYPTVTC